MIIWKICLLSIQKNAAKVLEKGYSLLKSIKYKKNFSNTVDRTKSINCLNGRPWLFNIRKIGKIKNLKKLKIGKMAPNDPKFFFPCASSSSKNKKKMSVAKLNSVGWFLRNGFWHET